MIQSSGRMLNTMPEEHVLIEILILGASFTLISLTLNLLTMLKLLNKKLGKKVIRLEEGLPK